MRKLLLAISVIAIILAACTPVQTLPNATQQNNQTAAPAPVQNQTVAVTPPPTPQQENIKINGSTSTLFNDKQQKFSWGTYVLELMYVSSDGTLCSIKINGKTGIYEKDRETPFDAGLSVQVLQAVPTHGFTGDACKVALYSPN